MPRNLLILLISFLATACTGSSSSQWVDMDHLYDNEIAPVQARVTTLEAQVADNERDIALLRQKIEDLRASATGSADSVSSPLAAPLPGASGGARLSSAEMLERDRQLDRDYGIGRQREAPARPVTPSTPAPADDDAAYYYEDDVLDGGSELFAIHLASYGTLQSAARGWRILSADFADTLISLTPWTTTVSNAETGETIYRLLAGPLTTGTEAENACTAFKARGAYCKPMPFDGDPLIVD